MSNWSLEKDQHGMLIISRIVSAPLLVPLSETEKSNIGTELAEINDMQERHIQDRKDFLDEWKKKNEEINTKFTSKLHAARTGLDVKHVECTEIFNHAEKTHYFEHGDKRHHIRAMEDHEYMVGQDELFPTESKESQPVKIHAVSSTKIKKVSI